MRLSQSRAGASLWVLHLILSSALAQNYFKSPPLQARRIAIVGGGVAGASSAYHLNQIATVLRSDRFQVTNFESSSMVGGRVSSVQIPDLKRPVPKIFESGALSFFNDDECLVDANTAVGKADTSYWTRFENRRFSSAAVWDGKVLIKSPKVIEKWLSLAYAFRFSVAPGSTIFMLAPWKHHRGPLLACDYVSPTWWELAQLTRQYGSSPWRLHRAVKAASSAWTAFARLRPFYDLKEALAGAGIEGAMLHKDAVRYLTTIGMASSSRWLSFSHAYGCATRRICMKSTGSKQPWPCKSQKRSQSTMATLSF